MKRFTIFMLSFIIVVYSLILLGKAHPHDHDGPKASNMITSQELDEREDLFKKNLAKNPAAMNLISMALTFLLIGGITSDAYIVSRKIQKLPIIHRSFEHSPAAWPLSEIFSVFVFLFFIEAALIFLEALGGIFFGWNLRSEFYLILNSLVRDGSAALYVIWLVRKKYSNPLSAIGLSVRDAWKNIRSGLLVYLAAVPFLAILLSLVSVAADAVKYDATPQQVVQIYLKKSTEPYLLGFTLFVAILGPIIEEIFFRGFMYKAFRTKWGVRGAVIFSAILFASLHHSLLAFIPIFLLGVVLALLYEKSGSLLAPMAFHVMHNFLMVLFTLTFKSMSS